MPPKRNRSRSHTPAWLDALLTWLEFIGMIATILAALYGLITWLL